MIRSNLSYKQVFRGIGLLLIGVLFVWSFRAVGRGYFEEWALDVGRATLPDEHLMAFCAFWMFLGGLAWWALTSGANRLLRLDQFDAQEWSDSWWMAGCAAIAFLLPMAIRTLFLESGPLTDDEHAYMFMARVLSEGHLYAESLPTPLNLFFDRGPMVNDGKWYAHYFIGWPTLLIPGVLVGSVDWVNPFYSALTVFPLFLSIRHTASRRAARFGAILFAASPFVNIAAATLSSHVTALLFVVCTWWALLATRQQSDHLVWHFLVGLFFSIAFFIRPLAALGASGPALALWVYDRVRSPETGMARVRNFAAFTAPCLLFAAAFLLVTSLQTGHAFQTAYQAYKEYAASNEFRFTQVEPESLDGIPNLHVTQPKRQVAVFGLGLFRFNIAAFGWPFSFLFALFAMSSRHRIFWLSACGYLVTRFIIHDPGVDVYGPVHYYELLWPLVALTAVGMCRLKSLGKKFDATEVADNPNFGQWPTIAFVTAILLSLVCYIPYRLDAASNVARAANLPVEVAESRIESKAVVFSPFPFARKCAAKPARPMAFWRPTNDPSFNSDIIWANHVSIDDNRRLMEYFPNRTGWILFWTDTCKLGILPLDKSDPQRIPRANIGGSERGPDWSKAPSPYNIDEHR